MKRILLFDTAVATSNLGDEIILSSVKSEMSEILDDAMCFRLATHIQNYSPFQMLYHGKKMHSICLDVDYKFICGTNCLVSNLLHIRPQLAVNYANSLLYKNSVLIGVGKDSNYEKFANGYTKRLYKKILSSEFKHSVRDEATKEALSQIGIEAINTGCPTLWQFDDAKCNSIPSSKADRVVFSVSGYDNQLDRLADKKMLDVLCGNYSKLYAWIQTTEDEKYLNSLLDSKKLGIVPIYSLSKLSNILNEGNIDYVGTRLHGGIFSLQHNIRSLIISIDERAKGFHQSNNIPILDRTNIDSLESTINGEIITDIKVNRNAVDTFINQFK